ncbi:hypothetical protein [Pseudokordiimonas caeni]|uniref:hypothetical protein n=1 Tax=Pseudokordiimonas caeni TaxID=2997908 RepID=UPI002810DE9A|nr:hypothetical protein [Pseudokordiimonas caeni]
MTSLLHALLFGLFVMIGAFGMTAFQDALGPVSRFWRQRRASRPMGSTARLHLN